MVQDDLGGVLWCVARTGGVEALAQVGISGPSSPSPPQILGDSRIGHTLTCARGGWDDPATPMSQLRLVPIMAHVAAAGRGGTGPTHVVDPGDATAQRLDRLVTAAGAQTALGTAAIDPPRTLVPPQISGDVRVGSELTCDPGTWDSDLIHPTRSPTSGIANTHSDPGPEPIESDAAHTVTNEDLGRTLWCVVKADGVGKAYDERFVPQPRLIRAPEVSGKPRIGGQLQCDRGIGDDPEGSPYPVSFAWYRDYPWTDPAPPAIDTGAKHTVVSADLAHTLTCVVSAPGGAQASGAQSVPGPEPVAPPAFDREPRPGIATTCSRGTWIPRRQPLPGHLCLVPGFDR